MPDSVEQNNEPSGKEQTQDFETMYKESSNEAHRLHESNLSLNTKLVKQDPSYLVELHGENPKVAEKIAQAEYGISYDEAKEQIE
jgi:hypothetical protein